MPKKSMCELVASCIEKYGYLILILILTMSLFVAWRIGFAIVDSEYLNAKQEVARLITSISFPMSGILLFVLGQSLVLREKYAGKYSITRIVRAYTQMSVISAITLVASAITGLLSFQYFKSGGNRWLTISLYSFLSVFILLLVNTIFFTIYTITVEKTIKNMDEIRSV